MSATEPGMTHGWSEIKSEIVHMTKKLRVGLNTLALRSAQIGSCGPEHVLQFTQAIEASLA